MSHVIRELLDEPFIDKCPIITDRQLKTELLLLTPWETIHQGNESVTLARKDKRVFIINYKKEPRYETD